jgi:hypothetical protein
MTILSCVSEYAHYLMTYVQATLILDHNMNMSNETVTLEPMKFTGYVMACLQVTLFILSLVNAVVIVIVLNLVIGKRRSQNGGERNFPKL